jgi:hypothetical protein
MELPCRAEALTLRLQLIVSQRGTSHERRSGQENMVCVAAMMSNQVIKLAVSSHARMQHGWWRARRRSR